MSDELITEFLEESNAIEDVFDEKALYLARKAFDYLLSQDKLTKENICKAHEILMKGRLEKSQLGKWRTYDVEVGYNPTPPWERVPELMAGMIEALNLTIDTHKVGMATPFHSVDETERHIKQDHVGFERIHPFADGNGRIGRMILNWQRIKCGLPLLVIYSADKQEYYDWFI